MFIVRMEEAQARLAELIDQLAPGEELVITRNHEPVARIIGGTPETGGRRGSSRGRRTPVSYAEATWHADA